MDLLTPKEVATRLRVTPQCVYEAFNRGEMQGFRAGRHLRIYGDSVEAYIAVRSNKKRPEAEPKPVPRPLKKKLVVPTSGYQCLLT